MNPLNDLFVGVKRELEKRDLEEDFLSYVKFVFEKIRREVFVVNWHHKVIISQLMDIYLGVDQFVIFNIPPRYTKTELVVKLFIPWCIAKNRKSRFIHLAYSDELSLDNSAAIKETIEHPEHQYYWDIKLKDDSQSKKKWYTVEGGGLYATAMGGQITGFGAGGMGDEFCGAVVIDDPIKPEDALSKNIRDKINERMNNTIKSRLNNPKKTPIIVIMQRLHEEDFTGYLLAGKTEFTWKHISIPALMEEEPNEYDKRQIGEPLWPFKHDKESLEAMAKASPKTYAGQYQQRPSPAEGNIVKRHWFKFYYELPPDLRQHVHSWDCTFKDTKNSDFVAGTVWARNTKDFYMIDCSHARMGFVDTLKAMKVFMNKHPYKGLLIEDKANGSAIIETLKEEFNRIIPINPTESKEARLHACSALIESGNVYLPHPSIAPWVPDFIDEVCVFPNGKHDDRVDSMTQALNYLDKKGNSSIYKMTGMA